MINGIETRVKIQQVLENQIPEFLLEESPKFVEFLKQYYISQEYQGGPVDISENLDQYLKLDNLTPEVIVGNTTLLENANSTSDVIYVDSTKGFPKEYGLLKIDDEVITYTGTEQNILEGLCRISVGSTIAYVYGVDLYGIDPDFYVGRPVDLYLNSSRLDIQPTIVSVDTTPGSQCFVLSEIVIEGDISTLDAFCSFKVNKPKFSGCIRGFSGITNYHKELDAEELVFQSTEANLHIKETKVENLSSLFLKEIYKKIKYTLTPGLEDYEFTSELNVGNFIKESRSLYSSKGIDESFRILFNVLYGIDPKVIDLEQFLIKPSNANYLRRELVVIERISGDPYLLKGQSIFRKNDLSTSASVSEVEIFTRKGKTYYKLFLFVGYDDTYPNITGSFEITSSSRILEKVSVGSKVISVDSTISFPESGKIYFQDNEINYKQKTINQFLDCYTNDDSSIQIEIPASSLVRSDDIYFGYENGNLEKEVQFRISGVLSKLNTDKKNKYFEFSEGDEIFVKSIGEKIENPIENKTRKEILANSFIYNTSCRFKLKPIKNGKLFTKSQVDKSSLKIGDSIEILNKGTEDVVLTSKISSIIKTIDSLDQSTIYQIDLLDSVSSLNEVNSIRDESNYEIRRKLEKSSSSIVPIEFGNQSILANIQNVYNENNDYLYIASNSLPSLDIETKILRYKADSIDANSLNSNTKKYSILQFDEIVSFVTGDEVYYDYSNSQIEYLERGIYYVRVLSDKKSIKLYSSRSFIQNDDYVEFGNINTNGSLPNGEHIFVLNLQKENLISPQKILKKLKINPDNQNIKEDVTIPGSRTGIMVNGVEILNYKSEDKVYYGPLKEISVLSGGSGYDVVNPPLLKVSSGIASVQPIVQGSVEKVFIEPYEFNINIVANVIITGGNGSGCVFSPIISKKRKDLLFDARNADFGGGLDINYETITFLSNHNLQDGEPLIYNSNGNNEIGISTNNSSNNSDQNATLINNATYYAKVVNDKTVQLFPNISDYNSGINTVRFTSVANSGFHILKTRRKNILSDVKVIDGGSGFTNRKLIVNPAGISTINSTINFENHGFLDGELISYSYENISISGLTTTNQYYVLKVNDDSFKVCDAGIGGTIRSDFDRKKFVKLASKGTGYQIFNYPEISVSVEYTTVGVGSTQIVGKINATPLVRGNIISTYLYNKGSDYGCNVLNLEKSPSIIVKNGGGAQLKPIIFNGKIIDVVVLYGGSEYYSMPDIEVIGDGAGCILKAILKNKKIVDVLVIESGIGYSVDKTSLVVKSAGNGAIFDIKVRDLTVNGAYKFGSQISETYREPASDAIIKAQNNLEYCLLSYSEKLGEYFKESSDIHSPIIGWAYDGNPIYGPYGYSTPNNSNSVKLLSSGYTRVNVENRPSDTIFPNGFFVEDYAYASSGDLDSCNGRYCITPEFPFGTYAYFSTLEIDPDSKKLVGSFPYFIGDKYRSKFIEENKLLNQSFNFNNSNLIRNTFPYKINDKYADNDFITESNELVNQKVVVEATTQGEIEGFDIIVPGDNYSVGDSLFFTKTDEYGGGLQVDVSEVEGINVTSINTNIDSYDESVITWNSNNEIQVSIFPSHNLNPKDNVNVYNTSEELSFLNGQYQVFFSEKSSSLSKKINSSNSLGIVTDIVLSYIPNNISIGSSIKINNEIFSILNTYKQANSLKVLRSSVGTSHSESSIVKFLPNSFTINAKSDYFESKINDKMYFNPSIAVGLGTTTGYGTLKKYFISETEYQIFVPTQSIYLPNHNFETNQKVILRKTAGNAIGVSTTPNGTITSLLPGSQLSQEVYVINKSKDFIGIVTNVGLTTNTSGLYFRSFNPTGYVDNLYSIESTKDNKVAKIVKIDSIVSVSTFHNLVENDLINLNVRPKLTVGIGTSISVDVKYDVNTNSILCNKITFNSSSVDLTKNTINIQSHNLTTGDKVYYKSLTTVSSGLSTGIYYVYKSDDNSIKLCETRNDSLKSPPLTVNILSGGGNNQQLWAVSPKIEVIKNNNLLFNLSDPSLLGYKLKIYYDRDFKKEFISSGEENYFNIDQTGTVGVSTSLFYVNYSDNIPQKLFYSLEKNGVQIIPDLDTPHSGEIVFIDSIYNGKFIIHNVNDTNFSISLQKPPERLDYSKDQCDEVKYSTKSKNALGSIKNVRIVSKGLNYKKVPSFSGSNTKNGIGAYLIPKSSSIGKLKDMRFINDGFEYLSDKTLRPKASIPKIIKIKSTNIIDNIKVINSGKNYTKSPDLIIVDSNSGEKINSGFLKADFNGSSILSVDIVEMPRGLPSTLIEIKAINNTNGIQIQEVESSFSGIVTCTLVTPLGGNFVGNKEPFKVGDKIYVENIEKITEDGNGFNSENYGYKFFTVTDYFITNPRKLEYSVSTETANTGIARTFPTSFPLVINYNDYPLFEVEQKFSPFYAGETVLVHNGFDYIESDLIVKENNENYLKLIGEYKLLKENVIKGKQSQNIAIVENINELDGEFEVNFSSRKKYGWKDNDGTLNDSDNVMSDNDYYQNLSYTIKSEKGWNEIVTPVNNLVHASGLKNFADTEITKTVSSGRTEVADTNLNLINNFINENRVDTINNLDLVIDKDIFYGKSNLLQFKKIKLSNYLEVKSNRVLEIDDISAKFSSAENYISFFSNIFSIEKNKNYHNFLIQVKDFDSTEIQIIDLVVIIDVPNKSTFTFQKASLSNTNQSFVDVYGFYDDILDIYYLKIDPRDIFNKDYDIKILNSEFSTNDIVDSEFEVGITKLIGINTSVNANETKTILSIDSTKYNALYTTLQIISNNDKINYAEIYIAHNNSNIFSSEYYFDSENKEYSSRFLGTFTSSLNSGILNLSYTNLNSTPILIRSKTVGIATTSSNISGNTNYRFKLDGQLDGTEKTALYNSSFSNILSESIILNLDKNVFSSVKSFVRVSVGSTIYLHQILATQIGNNSYIEQYPFLATSGKSGIGTFGAEIVGNDFNIKFYPDPGVGSIEVSTFNQIFYSESDFINGANTLEYSPIRETFSVKNFFGKNSTNVNTTSFDMFYDDYPIFKKTFNPSNSDLLDLSTGIFYIPNHFFVTGERLIYKAKSTFVGIAASEIKVGVTSLPNTVYAIKDNNDTFRLALTESDALNGICVTFSSYGSGNAHELEMYKKSEKCIITINDLIQYPIAFSKISYKLQNNIDSRQEILHLSGISTISLKDIIKIDNEYMGVENVGLGTSSLGPITFSGSFPLVKVKRGFVGSSATSHSILSDAKLYSGAFNIDGNKIFFTDAPVGLPENPRTKLPREASSFNGRVFLRSDYSSNVIFDDVSSEFTGIGQTYRLTINGSSAVGLGTSGGNGIVLVNGIFQSPTTENNGGNNYRFDENLPDTDIIFSGIRDNLGDQFTSIYDVNLNQLPRNGLIVSLGSTPGLGYAPLVGASATAIVNGSGTITNIILSDPGSGYRGPISIGITYSNHTGSNANITAIVGAGGTLSLSIANGGSGYVDPILQIPAPNYENLSIIGVSRFGIGQTTDTGIGLLVNAQVGPSSITAGIGSTLFSVNYFKISRSGYGFQEGDVFKVVGLVTAKGFADPVEDFLLTVTEIYTDSFSAWNFGELDYIDSILKYQDGFRQRFPLYYKSRLLSFEKNVDDSESNLIDMDSLLLIFINGVLQKPKEAYQFNGGSSFTFTDAPRIEDQISIFFYRGVKGVDSYQVGDIISPIEPGDLLQVYKNNTIKSTETQNVRTIYDIRSSDTLETTLYSEQGVDNVNYKPVYWTKKKYDQIINGEVLYKSRESIETQIYPTAKIIGNVSLTDSELFVDNASLFNYEGIDPAQIKFDSLIVSGKPDPTSASLIPVVSSAGKITSLVIENGGSGYSGSTVDIKFSSPIGIGSTAKAKATVSSAGTITTPITIVSSGSGYTESNLPQTIISLPEVSSELIKNATSVKNYSGVIVGIATTVGIGVTLAIKFTLKGLDPSSEYMNLLNCPIFISNTRVGRGVTSIFSNDSPSSIVGIGTTFLDNIYYVNAVSSSGIITCNVHSKSSLNGISTTGFSTSPVGRFSIGKISGFTRSGVSSISLTVYGNKVDVGLTTYPTVQRRGIGLRYNGSIQKDNI